MTTTELKPRLRLPDWLRLKLPTSDRFARTRQLLEELKLHTVCESARCPNHWECWSKGTATFMIAGDRCTRACGFCAVTTAKPLPLESDEPARVAEATHRMWQACHEGRALLLTTYKERAELYVEQFAGKGLKVSIEPA